jgi:glutamyl-tRNA synthetase
MEISMARVRFAPSPTGFLHVGSARTAVFNWLFARRYGGRFLLRIEDTDQKRSEARYLEEILKDLRWLGIDWDEEPVFQSRRFDVYRAKAEELIAAGQAYREGEAVLFRVEKGRTIEYKDMIHGSIAWQTDDIKDQVLIKSDGSPAYNFACVVDDSFMGISHILRGDDHISNTPKQILLYEAFGLRPPEFGHMPLILGPDGSKLSKRHGGVSVEEYKGEGFLPQALANYLFLLGWSPGEGREVLTLGEAVKIFEVTAMNAVQAKFDVQKLRWFNAEYIMKAEADDLLPLLRTQLLEAGTDLAPYDDAYIGRVLDLYRVRIKTLREFPAMTEYFFRDDFAAEDEGKVLFADPVNRERIALLAGRLESVEPFGREALEKLFRETAAELGIKPGQLIHPVRMAVSGRSKGAGLFEMMEVLGKAVVLRRLRRVAHGSADKA